MGVAVHPRRRTVRSRRCDFNKKTLKTLKLSLYDQIPSKKTEKQQRHPFRKVREEETKQQKSIPRNNQTIIDKKQQQDQQKKKQQPRKNQQRQKPLKKITNPRIFMKTTSSSDFFQYQITNYHSDPTRNQTSLKSCISTFSSVLE